MRVRLGTSIPLRTATVIVMTVLILVLGSGYAGTTVCHAQGCGGSIRGGQTVTGRISARGRDCRYTFSGSSGDTVTIRMEASSRGLDPYLELLDPSDQRVASDDDGAGGHDSLIRYTLRRSGTYTIVAGSYRGRSAGSFKLSLSVGDSRSSCGGSIRVGETVTGRIPARGQDCRYTFSGSSGDRVIILMEASSGGLDPYLDLLDPSDRLVASDDDGAGGYDSLIRYALRRSGTYTIVARSYEDQTYGSFSLSLSK